MRAPPLTPRPVARRWIVAAVVVLTALALQVSIARGLDVMRYLATAPDQRPDISPLDRFQLEQTAAVRGAAPGTPAYDDVRAQSRGFVGKFNAHPVASLLHVLPAVAFLILVPIQFSARIRDAHPRYHRWAGRVLLATAAVIGASGIYFGVFVPTHGAAEAYTIAVFGTFFFYAGSRALLAIRRGDVARHREWIIRTFAAALGISTVRLVAFPLAIFMDDLKVALVVSFWTGWVLTLGVAEVWIRMTRPAGAPAGIASAPATAARYS